jgi:hypothetical protein
MLMALLMDYPYCRNGSPRNRLMRRHVKHRGETDVSRRAGDARPNQATLIAE